MHDDLLLLNSGLESLCIAVLVALDDILGIDPFDPDGDVPVLMNDWRGIGLTSRSLWM